VTHPDGAVTLLSCPVADAAFLRIQPEPSRDLSLGRDTGLADDPHLDPDPLRTAATCGPTQTNGV